ncbi:MAG: MBL fold metallo-hydrolase [Burkholderiaceae bacterium]|nr:MBL fold metallo-hydrolase [Burkholderiaceae bacterium]
MSTPEDRGRVLKPASIHTCRANAALGERLDLSDEGCFDDALRGFIDTVPDARIETAEGRVVWDLSAYAFLESIETPDSVNPSLWRQARLNRIHGLFQVCERMYQVRGFDIANITIIEGDSGLILIDPLTVCESAAAALALYRRHRGDRPVRCVIYSHSHLDHYGGVEGVVSPAEVTSGAVRVIAPAGFMEAAVSENVLAGVPMRRRAMFQFGPTLAPGPRSHVDAGLGKTMGRGTSSLIAPTMLITRPMETHLIDGVEIVFQLTPETEAPAEMNFFFPQFKVLNLAENGCHTMHNLCPLRGARTRDALAWSKYLDAALDAFIENTDVVIAQHHWPSWGRERARRFITEQRDLYRVMHDQCLRLMSHGLTPNEIAAAFRMPASLEGRWHARPYYGAIAHNLRAIYAHYMGPYDGHPASLDPLPPQAAAKKTLEYMGGAEAVIERARRDFDAGEYRWVVEVGRHLVFADPANRAARDLVADAMEQLGYQSESSTWRNAYLLGAKELRLGVPKPGPGAIISRKAVSMLPMEMFFDYLAIRVNAEKAEGLQLLLDWRMTDEGSCHRLTLSNSALSHLPGSHGAEAMATISTDREALATIVAAGRPLAETPDTGLLVVGGDAGLVRRLFATFDEFAPNFAILEP